MSEIKLPSCGRIVHLFPGTNPTSEAWANQAEKCAAIVTQEFGGLTANMRAFPDSTQEPLWFTSVPHKSIAAKDESGNIIEAYWDWPPALKDIKVYIRTFLPILEKMMDDNMVLAGTLDLRLHGLNISQK